MSQPLFDFNPPVEPLPSVPYQAGSPTSKSGALVAQPKAGTQAAIILALIEAHPECTDRQLETWSGFRPSIVTPRRRRLEIDGVIVCSGRVKNQSGAEAKTWRVVENARPNAAEVTEGGAASHPLSGIEKELEK